MGQAPVVSPNAGQSQYVHHGQPHGSQYGHQPQYGHHGQPHYVHQPVMATPAVQPYGVSYGQYGVFRSNTNSCTGIVCLFGTSIGFGIVMVIVGFILLMVGYFAKPFFSKGSSFYDEEVQRLKNCRTAGWVLLVLGILLLIVGIVGVKNSRKPASVRNTQAASTATPMQQQVAYQPTAPPTMGDSTPQAANSPPYFPEMPCGDTPWKDDMCGPPSYDEVVGQ